MVNSQDRPKIDLVPVSYVSCVIFVLFLQRTHVNLTLSARIVVGIPEHYARNVPGIPSTLDVFSLSSQRLTSFYCMIFVHVNPCQKSFNVHIHEEFFSAKFPRPKWYWYHSSFLVLIHSNMPAVCRYRGGLDVANNQTGETSVYTEYKDRKIMFHVSTLLPHDSGDTQHVSSKSIINTRNVFWLGLLTLIIGILVVGKH